MQIKRYKTNQRVIDEVFKELSSILCSAYLSPVYKLVGEPFEVNTLEFEANLATLSE